jgi:hypothetical protein
METKTRINISKELPEKETKRVIDNIMVSEGMDGTYIWTQFR